MSSSSSSSDDDDDDMSERHALRLHRTILRLREFRRTQKGKEGPRVRRPRTDPWNCTWGKMLLEQRHELEDPDSAEALSFRLRFRVPFPLFLSLVKWTSECFDWSPTNPTGIRPACRIGIPKHPTEMKVLGVLRMLGRGTCLDGILELSGISPAVMSRFFHAWCAKFVEKMYPEHVRLPETKEVSPLCVFQFVY